MSNTRDRQRAKRRYLRRQASLAAKARRGQKRRRIAGSVVAVFVVVGVAFGVRSWADDTPAPERAASDSVTDTASPSASKSEDSSSPTASSAITAPPPASLAEQARWQATVKTTVGTMVLNLDGKVAPQTVASFLNLSRKNFYDDTTCHRLTTEGIFVLQCGDPDGTGSGGPGYSYGIENAPKDGKYLAGTLAMARTADPNSNGSQFFMVYDDTTLPVDGGGYTIFGEVQTGLDVLREVAAAGVKGGGGDGTPEKTVTITDISVERI
ncbi:MAG: peptidylprolyl isomerase [Actinomycetota bacterium]